MELGVEIEPYEDSRLEEIVRLSLRAWEPVFLSIEGALDADVYQAFYPNGWRVAQQSAVEAACSDEDTKVWVAVADARTVGFVALKCHTEDNMGEIHMIAVDLDYQRRGVATALMNHALDWFRQIGASVAMVETGGDPGHEPACLAYASVGFRLFPVARYFKKL